MSLNPFHEAHIRRVRVSFDLTAPALDPEAVTSELAIPFDASAKRGDPHKNYVGKVIGVEEEGWWQLSSAGKVESKDVNEHFRYLLNRLLPWKDAIMQFAREGETYFGVLWESTYLYAGTGPMLSKDVIAGIAALGAEIGFDIYQIDETEESE